MNADRKKIAIVYKQKSDESYSGAQKSLQDNHYRNTCNRAWYATMQIITAAAYEVLSETPPHGQQNWDHERQSTLFRGIAAKHGVWKENISLATEIDMMRERRNHADYVAPVEPHADRNGAEKSLETAGKVRELIIQLIGDKWTAEREPATTGEQHQ